MQRPRELDVQRPRELDVQRPREADVLLADVLLAAASTGRDVRHARRSMAHGLMQAKVTA